MNNIFAKSIVSRSLRLVWAIDLVYVRFNDYIFDIYPSASFWQKMRQSDGYACLCATTSHQLRVDFTYIEALLLDRQSIANHSWQ